MKAGVCVFELQKRRIIEESSDLSLMFDNDNNSLKTVIRRLHVVTSFEAPVIRSLKAL